MTDQIEIADRKIRVSNELMWRLAERLGVYIVWGEPDAEGFYEPQFVKIPGITTDEIVHEQHLQSCPICAVNRL